MMTAIVAVVRVLLGALFVVSGVLKLGDPAAFLDDAVMTFQLVARPVGYWIALVLPWFEVVAGLCLLSGKRIGRTANIQLLLLTLVFTVVIAMSWARGLDITCGCFGPAENLTNYPEKIGTNLLIIVGLSLALYNRPNPRKSYKVPMIMAEGAE